MEVIASVGFIGFSAAVAGADLRFRRIPNWLNTAGVVAALGLTILANPAHLAGALLGLGVGFAVGFLLFALKTLGAGDAKFLAAVGAWAGLERLPAAFLAMLAGGAVFAVVWAIRHRILGGTLLSTSAMIGGMLERGERLPPIMGDTPVGRFPYGVGLGLGAVAWWVWAGGVLP
jgi:prepilin peptidase CpaA